MQNNVPPPRNDDVEFLFFFRLQHAADEAVDVLLTITELTTLHEGDALLVETAVGAVELERPEEVVGLTEVPANGVDLVHKILDADDAVLAESLLDHRVLRDRDALAVDLAETALVDQLPNGLEVGGTAHKERERERI